MNYDVFFYEAYAEEQAAIARHLNASIRAGFTRDTIQQSGHAAPPAALISIRTQSALPSAWHGAIRGVLSRTTGFDHLLAIQSMPGAPATACLPEYCSRAVAEQALTLWMALLRRLPRQLAQWPRFNRDGLTGLEASGRTLVVAGVGRIGHEVVALGRALGMRVLGVDLVKRHSDVEYVDLDQGIERADVLVLCMNLTPENRGLFSYARLQRAKPGCLLINVARGELVVTADLIRLLAEERLGGCGLDVFDDETTVADALRNSAPHPEADRLRQLAQRPNVLLTPHNAFNTNDALERKASLSAHQTQTFLERGKFAWPLPA